jgi:hypothetical protein
MDSRDAAHLSQDERQRALEAAVGASEQHARLQVVLLQRISGYMHVIQWALVFAALMLFLLAIK